jgi:hypothetical protein
MEKIIKFFRSGRTDPSLDRIQLGRIKLDSNPPEIIRGTEQEIFIDGKWLCHAWHDAKTGDFGTSIWHGSSKVFRASSMMELAAQIVSTQFDDLVISDERLAEIEQEKFAGHNWIRRMAEPPFSWWDVEESLNGPNPIPKPVERFVEDFPPGATMAHVMHHIRAFASIGDARRNGWNRPIEPGIFTIGKGKNKKSVLISHRKNELIEKGN